MISAKPRTRRIYQCPVCGQEMRGAADQALHLARELDKAIRDGSVVISQARRGKLSLHRPHPTYVGVFQRCRWYCPVGDECPNHAWSWYIELPASPDGTRRQRTGTEETATAASVRRALVRDREVLV